MKSLALFLVCLTHCLGCAGLKGPVKPAVAQEALNVAVKNQAGYPRVGPYLFMSLGHIDQDEAKRIITGLQKAEMLGRPVLLEIDSPGGSVEYGYLIARAIERVDVKVTCRVDYRAFSMAMYILPSCDERESTARGRLMAHQPVTALEFKGTVNELYNEADDLAAMWRAFCVDMARHSRVPYQTWIEKTSGGKNWYIDAQEALDLGIIDRIVEPIRPTK